MKNYHYEAADETALLKLAECFSQCLVVPLLLTFQGELGAGKSTFIRGLLRGLGIKGPIKSPSFSLLESYTKNGIQIHHLDLYRIHNELELEYLGFRDLFTPQAICCIEWPERVPACLQQADIHCSLTILEQGRQLDFTALTNVGASVLTCVMGTS